MVAGTQCVEVKLPYKRVDSLGTQPVSSRERRADEIYERPDRYLKVVLSLPYGKPEFLVCVYMFDYQHELSQPIYTQEIARHVIPRDTVTGGFVQILTLL